jgi:hypothetical protein
MKILCVLGYPGYLRYFDSTLDSLCRPGNDVLLAFDRPDYQAEGLKALDHMKPGIEVIEPAPRRKDLFAPFVRGLRAAVDYARYLDPRFEDADYLRTRRRKALTLTQHFGFLARLPVQPRWRAHLLVRFLLALEAATPSAAEIEEFIAEVDPDVVLISPLISQASPQTDVVKSARALGIPTILCVASWDHLTTKGVIRVMPERIAVWNYTQQDEAVELHGVPKSRIAVTGAQPFDKWFGREPKRSRAEFCKRVGLEDERPFVLFTGSTAGISRPEAEEEFVREWIAALRATDDPKLREIAVLIRPHPYNPGRWGTTDLSGLGSVSVWPRAGANPVDEDDRADYFDSLYHCDAVVGVNTSAMIEAAIVGRPVHTILAQEFQSTQRGTLHFHYLLPENGGFLRTAADVNEHVVQLAATLADPAKARAEVDRFVDNFIRPHGRDKAATPLLVDAIEGTASLPVRRSAFERLSQLLRPLAVALAVSANRRGVGPYIERVGDRIAGLLDGLSDLLAPSRPRMAKDVTRVRKRVTSVSKTTVGWLKETHEDVPARRKRAKRAAEEREKAAIGAAEEGID